MCPFGVSSFKALIDEIVRCEADSTTIAQRFSYAVTLGSSSTMLLIHRLD